MKLDFNKEELQIIRKEILNLKSKYDEGIVYNNTFGVYYDYNDESYLKHLKVLNSILSKINLILNE